MSDVQYLVYRFITQLIETFYNLVKCSLHAIHELVVRKEK